jgi:peroxiredoxin
MPRCILLAILLTLGARASAADETDDTLAAYREIIAKDAKSRTIDDKTNLLKLGDRLYRWAKKNESDKRASDVLLALCEDRPLGAQAAGAIRLLLERSPESRKWADLCEPISETQWSDADAMLAKLAETSPHDLVKASALWSQSRRALAAALEVDPLDIKSISAKQQAAMQHLRAIGKLKQPLKLEDEDLRDLAKAKLEVLERNALGIRAPEVAGLDLQGEELKLTAFRGKVVVMIFWGAWCPVCREQFPAEKELAAKYKNKPVVLLGVNSDTEVETALKIAKAEGLNWPSYFDEGSTRGPIARQWGVEFWPTVILLDHRGVIRYRFQGMKKVDEAVSSLLKEV